jgi:hypothetical protein
MPNIVFYIIIIIIIIFSLWYIAKRLVLNVFYVEPINILQQYN